MKTLIELYDERTIENVIGPETFKPEKVVYLCSTELMPDKRRQLKLKEFFSHRGLETELTFIECSQYKYNKVYEQLKNICSGSEDCAIEVSGGADPALFAAGMICSEMDVAAFTYSRKQNSFYNIKNAPFADNLKCDLEYSVEDFFLMAGGTMRKGRVDNRILHRYMDIYDDFFGIFLKHHSHWAQNITFMQKISKADYEGNYSLKVKGNYEQKGEHGRVKANPEFLHDIKNLGFIKNLQIVLDVSVEFEYVDDQKRAWLRDVGSVLELYIYKKCIDTGIFGDVVSSAIVDWDGTVQRDSVSNEIDVVAARGVLAMFISCKACEVSTYALNELAILRDRFGGKGAKAVIVTTEFVNAAARHRAAQLGIAVIDREELENDLVVERLKTIMKVNKE